MNREEWDKKFIEILKRLGMSEILAKFLAKIRSHYDNGLSPEEATEIEFTKLYR